MERRRFISDCVIKAAEELGYPTMKMEQLDVAIRSPTCMACGRLVSKPQNYHVNVYI